MRRLVLMLILTLGVTFACDQNYEEVEGIKIGCPIDEAELSEYDFVGPSFPGSFVYVKKGKMDGFFDRKNIFLIDGVISGVHLYRNEKPINVDELKDLVAQFTEKWGEHIYEEYGDKAMFWFTPSEGTALSGGSATIIFEKSGNSLGVFYLNGELEKLKNSEEI